ncbi:MAG: helix-turn-helix domain-containing protein [Deltaproteobacteria bacterium]|jgi:putative transcriptional regulator|nr:helix-turn-helix domain-containing protein [Deltaproteobacteria bacterium]
MKKKSRIIEEMYESMRDLHAIGAIDDQEMDAVASIHDSYKAPQYSADMVKNLRQRLNLTQVSLASVLNTSTSSVQQWEQGAKKPGGPSCKLLYLLDRKGIAALL